MSLGAPPPDDGAQAAADAAELERFGYKQELRRGIGGFGSFALSFSVVSILTGAVQLYGHGLRFGGPLVMSLGWWAVSLATLTVAMSMAELASALPMAGGPYPWARALGGDGAGFFTAWFLLLGQIAVVAGVDYGLAQFLAPMLGLGGERATVLALFGALVGLHGLLNHVGVRVVNVCNGLSAWYHLAGVALLIGLLVVLAPLAPLARMSESAAPAGMGLGYAFVIGLLQAQWTFTGYEAAANVTEETLDPRWVAPWGIFLSVAVSAVFGSALLVAVTLAAGDLGAARAAENPFLHALGAALGPRLGTALVWVAMGAMWFCGLGSVTSTSRLVYAYARDRGLPPSLARVSPRFRTPAVAIWATCAGAVALALWSRAYEIMIAISTLGFYLAYALPVACLVLARRSGRAPTPGPWHLGRFAPLVNAIALGWTAFITVVFVLPQNDRDGLTTAYTLGGVLLALSSAYALHRVRRSARSAP